MTALGQLAVYAHPLLPELIQATRDADPRIRDWALWAIDRIDAQSKLVDEAIQHALEDSDRSVRATALRLQFLRGCGARDAAHDCSGLKALENCRDTDPSRRARAILALAHNSPDPSTLSALKDAFRDTEARVRRAACAALRGALITHKTLRAALMRALKDTDRSVRQEATLAIGRLIQAGDLGIEELACIVVLERRLAGADIRLAIYSTWALEKIGPRAAVSLPSLRKALSSIMQRKASTNSDEEVLRRSLEAAIAKIDEDGQ